MEQNGVLYSVCLGVLYPYLLFERRFISRVLVEKGITTRDPRADALEAGGSVLCCEFYVNALRNKVSRSVWCVLWFMVLGLGLFAAVCLAQAF